VPKHEKPPMAILKKLPLDFQWLVVILASVCIFPYFVARLVNHGVDVDHDGGGDPERNQAGEHGKVFVHHLKWETCGEL
jgi:hypothetical protein